MPSEPTPSTVEAGVSPPPKRNFPQQFPDQPSFSTFIKLFWIDILFQLLCALSALMIYLFAKPLLPRYFPVYDGMATSAWGLKHGRHFRPEYITTLVSALVSFFVPVAAVVIVGLCRARSFWDVNAAIMSIGSALAAATLFQALIKWIIGGLRPNFLAICRPSIPTGMGQIPQWYTANQICTGDRRMLRDAQMSFPSGHSVAAFAGFGFLSLYLWDKFRGASGQDQANAGAPAGHGNEAGASMAGETSGATAGEKDTAAAGKEGAKRTTHWRLVLITLPLLIAFLLSASKVRDGWHHPIDVVCGALIGTAFALLAYRLVYRNMRRQGTGQGAAK
ncbi:PAP2-domain-containing protein [Byssothecium circinans]|uniref:PAP2-domain-containing protein n=1 Tax=Byssothecium circinans TaxID=147558 RepID=A0A6A5TE32_9PLEO|nr:PAP2-domain-containing protein [Byssothecium circinans]